MNKTQISTFQGQTRFKSWVLNELKKITKRYEMLGEETHKRSIDPHNDILVKLLPNKRGKENIESKPQC